MPPAGNIVSSSRRFPRQKYASLAEFKEFAKPLGFTHSVEYKNWSKTANRPPHIPARPDNMYRHLGWKSWMDALGYEVVRTRPLKWATGDAGRLRNDPRMYSYGNKRAKVSEAAIEWFLKTLTSLGITDEYEFERLPRSTRGTLLVRSKQQQQAAETDSNYSTGVAPTTSADSSSSTSIFSSSNMMTVTWRAGIEVGCGPQSSIDEPEWKMLHVTTASARNRNSKAFLFKKRRFTKSAGVVILCPPSRLLEIVHPDDVSLRRGGKCDWFLRDSIPQIPRWVFHSHPAVTSSAGADAETHVASDPTEAKLLVSSSPSTAATSVLVRIRHELRAVLDRLPAKTEAAWIHDLETSFNFRAFNECFVKLRAILNDAGLPRIRAIHDCSGMYNAKLGPHYVVVRGTTLPKVGSGGIKVHLERQKRIEKQMVRAPFDVADGIDFVIAMVYGTEQTRSMAGGDMECAISPGMRR